MIIIEAIGKNFHIRGRRHDGSRYVKSVEDFIPYFYIQNTNGKYRSLFDDKLRKVEVNHPAQIREEREKHERTYEADITYVNRFLIDRYSEIPQEPIRYCMLDIEVDDSNGFPSIIKADKCILSITCYDSFKHTFYVFVVKRDVKEDRARYTYKNIPVIEFRCVDEITMLKKYVDFIRDFDHDILLAWNGDGFDFPYISNRLALLNLDPRELSPIKQIDEESKKARGRVWLDLMRGYRKLSTHELESYSLDFIGKEELGEGKLEKGKGGLVSDLYKNNYEDFIKYNIHDVWIMLEIEKKKGIINYFDTVRRMTFSTWYDVFFNSRVLDFYFLKKAKEYGVCLPTKKRRDDKYISVAGARVIEPVTGISERVAVGDVRSLYPTAILTCNMSPETIIRSEAEKYQTNFVKVDNVCFRIDKRGFVPKVVEEVWDFRQKLKTEMKKHPIGSSEHEKYDNMQTVAKFLLNSIYGVMLAPHFRLFTKEIGSSVTYFGRQTNIWMEEKIRETGSNIIAGDTDSIFFTLSSYEPENMVGEGILVIDFVNSTLNKFCEEKFGSSQYNKMFIEFEKIYDRVLFLKAKDGKAVKKRYAGLISWKEGKMFNEEPILEVKGFETKRSDTPFIFRGLQKKILQMILEIKGNENDARKLITSILKEEKQRILNGEYNIEDIAIPKGMSKPITEYISNIPIHIAGALYYNKFFDGHIKQEKLKYIYVNKQPDGLPHTHVISFPEKCPDGFEINYTKMAQLLINDKFDSIFFSLDWDISDIDPEIKTLEKWL